MVLLIHVPRFSQRRAKKAPVALLPPRARGVFPVLAGAEARLRAAPEGLVRFATELIFLQPKSGPANIRQGRTNPGHQPVKRCATTHLVVTNWGLS